MLDKNLDDLFWELKSCPSDSARAKRLGDLHDTDPQLAVQLEQLLRADAELGGFMQLDNATEATIASEASATDPMNLEKASNVERRSNQEAEAPLTEQIGPYRLLEPIGEGGMGVVYLAQQSKPVRRKVAIKVIKPGMDSRQVIARFEAERQALAMMEHANIAKVLDAGTTESGLPYFVMELVRGIPMTEYCDRASMTTRQRLELFQDACAAIQHAHNKGIIHRDIKPSNVLVTEHDGIPVVKVIDFGVAKALTDNLTDKTLFTGMFQMLGTPLYMSPEQASLSNLDVDIRSDVYSLGVLLYELLSGTLPIDRASVRKMSLDELRRHICHTEPPCPSRRLSTLRDQGETIVERSGINRHQLAKTLAGELDWIVMKAIEKDRKRRYQSARELAEDIHRYLGGEAVEACPPSISYKLRKQARLHKGLLATLTVIAATLMIATGVSVLFALRATEALRQAEAEKEKAVTAQHQSENNFSAALAAIDKLLEHASSAELAEVPQVQPIRKKILEDVLAFYKDFSATTGESQQTRFRAGQTWIGLGYLAEGLDEEEQAVESFQRAIAIARSLTSTGESKRDHQLLLLSSLDRLGSHYLHRRKNPPKAKPLYEEKLNLIDQFLDDEPQSRDFWIREKLVAYRHLADVARNDKDYELAVKYISKAEEIAGVLDETDSSAQFKRHKSLAVNYEVIDPEVAERHYRRSVELGRQVFATDTPRAEVHAYASYLLGCAGFFQPRDPQFAYEVAVECAYIYEELTREFPSVLIYRRHLDYAIARQFTLVRGGNITGVSVNSLIERLLKQHPQSDRVLREYAEQAILTSDATIEIDWELFEPQRLDPWLWRKISDAARSKGQLETAMQAAQNSIDSDPGVCAGWVARGATHDAVGKYEEAIADYTRAIERHQPSHPSDSSSWIYKRRARSYFMDGQFDEALADLSRALKLNVSDDSILTWISPSRVRECPDASFREGMLRLADQAVDVKPESVRSRFKRGQLRAAVGRDAGAVEDFAWVIDRQPNEFELRKELIELYADRQRWTEAAEEVVEAIEIDGDEFLPRYYLGLITAGMNDQEGYRKACQAMLQASVAGVMNGDAVGKHFVAWTAALAPGGLDDYGPAIKLARDAVKSNPNDQQYLGSLGAILFRSGDFKSSRIQFRQAMDFSPHKGTSQAYHHYFLAMTQHAMGDEIAAGETLTTANSLAQSELSNSPPWNRKLTLELLRNEAEAVLNE